MRKQDRIAAEQNRSPQHSETKEQPHPTEREQMKGSASQNAPRPQREKGKLPLPD
jgi:hypothetical protein